MLGTPPAFILSQDQTLEIFLYTSLFWLTYLLFRARSALSYCLEYLLLESRVLALPVSISLYLVPLYFSRSHTSLYVCCSIFNDPIPLVPSRRQLCYYTTPPLACQPLLKSFFKFFSTQSPLLISTRLAFRFLPRQLCYTTTFILNCQAVWTNFSKKM